MIFTDAEIKDEYCEFEGDGEKHTCYHCKDENAYVENCKKCHRDRCSNPKCSYNEKIKIG